MPLQVDMKEYKEAQSQPCEAEQGKINIKAHDATGIMSQQYK